MRGLPLVVLPAALGGIGGDGGPDRLPRRIGRVLPRLTLARDELRHEGHHHHAAVLRQPGENRVRHVARMVHQRARGRVREDDRRLGHVERIAHGPGRDVRQVHEHAQPVHLAHHLAPELRESAVPRAVERGVGPVERHVVGQRHVARAEGVVGAQRAERVLDGVPALHAEEGGQPPMLDRALDVVRRRGRRPAGRDSARSSGGRCRTARAAPGRSRCPSSRRRCRSTRTARRPAPA